ncbi:hypothetical protein KBB68_03330 [Candidatus Babeliales bacterium]|nr:hypothetical protein [Candidatus Babeliales bacterium]
MKKNLFFFLFFSLTSQICFNAEKSIPSKSFTPIIKKNNTRLTLQHLATMPFHNSQHFDRPLNSPQNYTAEKNNKNS